MKMDESVVWSHIRVCRSAGVPLLFIGARIVGRLIPHSQLSALRDISDRYITLPAPLLSWGWRVRLPILRILLSDAMRGLAVRKAIHGRETIRYENLA